jgi:hypothetical protein
METPNLRKSKPITEAGRSRVEHALKRHGLVLTQGQWEIPSLADLLAGKPITTRGYSWDYVPAWDLCDELEQCAELGRAKLFRGRSTLISKRLWPAVDTLARHARERVRALSAGSEEYAMLEAIEAQPRISGGELREHLGLEARAFQRIKGRLEQRLTVFGREREDLDHHTHESCWLPWSASKIATGLDRRRSSPDPETATALLLEAVYPSGRPEKMPRLTTLFPVLH